MSNKSRNGMARNLRLFLLALAAAFILPVGSAAADMVPPQLSSLAQPDAFTTAVNNTVIFASDEATTLFECRTVDNTGSDTTGFATGPDPATGFAPCDPGTITPTMGWQKAEGQTDGRKGLQVRATDADGNTQISDDEVLNDGGLTVYWTVDNTAPVVAFAAGTVQEGSNTTSTSATINVTSSDAPIDFGVDANGIAAQEPVYECSLDSGAWESCDSSVELTGLTAGHKSFRVRVTDQATNVSTVIERKWTVVDGTNASVSLSVKPDPVIGGRTATYEFAPDLGTAECRIDASEAENANDTGWAACSSPHSFTGLADGPHQAEIRADASSVPAVDNFAVYADLPTVSIDSRPGTLKPDGKRYTGLGHDADEILFSAPDNPAYAPGATTFECRYYRTGDLAGPWEDCESPYGVNWDDQDDLAEMNFEVRPISSTGNLGGDQSTAWTIQGTQPTVIAGNGGVSVACGNGSATGPGPLGCVATENSTEPGSRSSVLTPRFQFTSSRPVDGEVGFSCQLNENPVHDPCVDRTTSLPAGGNPLTIELGGTRGDNDQLGDEIEPNAENTLKVWATDPAGNVSAAPLTFTWIHDSIAPTFALDNPMPARTNKGTATDPLVVDITADEDVHAGNGIRCMLVSGVPADATDPGDDPSTSSWDACTSQPDLRHAQWSSDSLAEGSYYLDIRGYDEVWNVARGTTPETQPAETDNNENGRRYVFTIDRTAPVTSITGGPAEGSTDPHVTGQIEFETDEPAAHIEKTECRLDPADPNDYDAGDWTDCDSPYEYEDLADGAHLFQVRALDAAGNQGLPVTRQWTIDSTLPVVTMSSDIPGTPTNQTDAEFTFSVTPVDSTLECRLTAPAGNGPLPVGDSWAACASPVSLTGLVDGEYTFEVKGTNILGTVGEIKTKTWTIDTVAPNASIDSGPSGTTRQTAAEFEFTSDKAGSSFECRLDAGAAQPCDSPKSYTGLSDGSHTFGVRATDPAGNVGAWAERNWSIDTVAPVVTITSGPSGTVQSRSASFEFTVDKAGSTIECQLNGGAWSACSSPQGYSDLADGLQTVKIRATDTLGNVGSPTERNWAIVIQECPPGQVGTFPDCAFPTREATVTKSGNGQGTVRSAPAGIECGNDCTDEFTEGATVVLTAEAAAGSKFVGWTGACTGSDATCTITMSQDRTANAEFELLPTTCPDGQIGTPPNCEEPPPATCEPGQFGTPPNCVTPLPPLPKPNASTGSYDPVTGKLAIRLKCPGSMKPKCIGSAVAVTGKSKKAKVMSSKVKSNSKAGKWKLVTITIKPAYRETVQGWTAINAKKLIIRQTVKSKRVKKKRNVFQMYKVRVNS